MTIEEIQAGKDKLSFKSSKECLAALDGIKAKGKELLTAMTDEKGEFKATTTEQREQLGKINADIAIHRAFLSERGEQEQFKSALNQGDTPIQYPKGAFGGGFEGADNFKSIGEIFIESEEYKSKKGSPFSGGGYVIKLPDVFGQELIGRSEYKAAVVENTMYAPPNFRIPLAVPSAQRPAILQDYIPTIQTSERNSVPFMQETTFTNNAAFVAQTVAPSDSVTNWTAASQAIETLVGVLPVTEQMMEDNLLIQGLLNSRMKLMMDQTLETELISGSGSTPHLKGYLNAASINHQAKGADDIYTAIAKGFNLNRWTGYSEPDYLVMHSTDYMTIRTTKDALGNFIFGKPNDGNTDLIWGLPIIITNGITVGTALTGSFKAMSARYIARGLTIEVGRINDNFTTLQWSIRATQREGLVINRGTAFTYIDGL